MSNISAASISTNAKRKDVAISACTIVRIVFNCGKLSRFGLPFYSYCRKFSVWRNLNPPFKVRCSKGLHVARQYAGTRKGGLSVAGKLLAPD